LEIARLEKSVLDKTPENLGVALGEIEAEA